MLTENKSKSVSGILSGKRNVTPEKTQEIFSKYGVSINRKDAEEALDIMYFIAKLIIKQNLNS